MKTKNTVPIVFTFDNNFFVAAMVTFHSMLRHAHENTFYDIFIMLDVEKFKAENKNDLARLENDFSHKCKITFIDMKNFGDGFAIQDPRFNFSVYYRLFIHNYIHIYDKVIFSDVDIIIVKDLNEIYQTDISDYYLGAIKQTKVNSLSPARFKKYINKATDIKQGNYFNAGFLLMNLKKIREGNFTEEFIKLSKVGFNNNDQDILNHVFQNQVKYIGPKYCYIPAYSYFKKIDRSKFTEMFSPAEINEYENDPAIIHYASMKPWNINKLEITDLELEKYKLWWDEFNQGLTYINNKAVFDLFKKLNDNMIKIADDYNQKQTIPKTLKRLVALTFRKLGLENAVKSILSID
ncbi:MAG TPA: hypothetical protein DGG95_11255 [Cytophagales bacterium]|jgi:UDP-glucose:(galactosyl)LPS alpha-1,2-glucosyltransferase|nr:hypothetical protein [Cytophagales bacterium]